MKFTFLKVALIATALSVSSLAKASLITINSGDLLGDNSTLNFESAALGVIGNNDSLFTNFGFSSVELLGSASGSDAWDSGVDGQGLAVDSNGQLIVVGLNDAFTGLTAGSSFSFNLTGTITQFGFQLIDQINNSMTIETYLHGNLVDSIAYNPTGAFPNPSVYYSSSIGIDSFRVVSNDGNGWGLDNLVIAGVSTTSVPEPSTIMILALGMIGLASRNFKK